MKSLGMLAYAEHYCKEYQSCIVHVVQNVEESPSNNKDVEI